MYILFLKRKKIVYLIIYFYIVVIYKEKEVMNLGGIGGRIGFIKGWKEERNRL